MDEVRAYEISKVSMRFAEYITQLYVKFTFFFNPRQISPFF